MTPGLHWLALTPQPLSGGRGGVGPGVPHTPYYPGPQAEGWRGMGEGGELTAHNECWLATEINCIHILRFFLVNSWPFL